MALSPQIDRLVSAIFAALCLFVSWTALTKPMRLEGDAIEYIVQTQSIVLDGSLSIDTAKRAEYWNSSAPYKERLGISGSPGAIPLERQAGGGFGGLYSDRSGSFSYYHFWLYSLVVAPIYWLFHFTDPGQSLEYHAFRVSNVLCFLGVMTALWRSTANGMGRFLLLSLICSPLVGYLSWEHPEVFLFTLLALPFTGAGGTVVQRLGPGAIALAASQVLPAILFLVPHVVLESLGGSRERSLGRILSYAYAGCLTGLSLAYFYLIFGSASPISELGFAQLQYASFARMLHFFLSPMIGALWFFPCVFLLLPTIRIGSRQIFWLGMIPAFFLAVWASCTTANFNSAQIGSLRYSLWLLAPIVAYLCRTVVVSRAGWGLAAIGVAIIFWFELLNLPAGDDTRFRNGQRATVPATTIYRRIGYREEVETMVENIGGHELLDPSEFKGVYILNLGGGHRIWVITLRALRNMSHCSWAKYDDFSYRAFPPAQLVRTTTSRRGLIAGERKGTARHPVWGGYYYMFTDGALDDFRCDVPVTLR